MDHSTFSSLHASPWIAGPMIKVSSLPFRLTCLDFGADIVYSEELVGTDLALTSRQVDSESGVVDFLAPTQKIPLFSTHALEKNHVVAQLGVADALTAVKAATVVANDVSGIDINMGCPKSFSVKQGMGAKLLCCPDRVEDILKTLKRNLPTHIRLSCKIRLRDQLADTIEFLRCCEKSGVDAIAVHARTLRDRPAQPAQWSVFSLLKSSINVPLIANGDFINSGLVTSFYDQYMSSGTQCLNQTVTVSSSSSAADGIMFARGIQWNPSLFLLKRLLCARSSSVEPSGVSANCFMEPVRSCVLRIIEHAIKKKTELLSLRWMLNEMVIRDPTLRSLGPDVRRAPDLQQLKFLFSVSEAGTCPPPSKKPRV